MSLQQAEPMVRSLWEQPHTLGRFLKLSTPARVAAFDADLPRAREIAEAVWPAASARRAPSVESIAHHASVLSILQDDGVRPDSATSPLDQFRLTGSSVIYDLLGRQELSGQRLEDDAVVRCAYWRGMSPARRGVAALRRLRPARASGPTPRDRGR